VSLIPNLTTKNVHRLVLAVAISMMCQTVSAQNRYPLHTSHRIKPATPQTHPLQISDLPKLPEVVEQQAIKETVRRDRPVTTGKSLAEAFDTAYGDMDVDRTEGSSFHANVRRNAQAAKSSFAPKVASRSDLGSYPTLGESDIHNPSVGAIVNEKVDSAEYVESRQPANYGDFVGSNSSGAFQQQADTGSESTTWWKEKVLTAFDTSATEQPVNTNSLVYATLQNSPRIKALSQNPLIRELQIIEADADFDPTSFVRSLFEDRVDPIGNVLSGVPDGILKDNIWSGEFGLRRKLRTGATYELGQKLGFKNSNSSFFEPEDQATATLALNVTQPVLRGGGRYYNQSQILIAQSASGAAWDTFVAELQEEIQETVSAYWELYANRSSYLQKQRNVQRGVKVLEILEGRRDLDSLPSQILRARSAVKLRKIALANALRDIRDSETELRRLTADRDWQGNQNREMIPTEIPTTDGIDIGLEKVVLTAIENRPEIKEAMARAKIAGIQRDISENELLPELSLLLGTYVSGLEGDSQMGQAIQNQFGETTPGYSVGFEFEFPVWNRAARSRFAQRQLQLAKIRSEVDETMLNVIAESQVALRRVIAAKETLDAALQAVEAGQADLEQFYRRWESFALIEGDIADGRTPTTALDQLLDSQERLTAAELVFTRSETELKIAEVELQRAMGTLLIHEDVSYGKSCVGGLPEMIIDKSQVVEPPAADPIRGESPTQQPTGVAPNAYFTPAMKDQNSASSWPKASRRGSHVNSNQGN
jgi:outer membrane protein TolC